MYSMYTVKMKYEGAKWKFWDGCKERESFLKEKAGCYVMNG